MTLFHRKAQEETEESAEMRVEYSVYTVTAPELSDSHQACWEKKHVTSHRRKALARAKILHRTGDYSRVEVKKTVCMNERIYSVSEGYKVFEKKRGFLKGRQAEKAALAVCGAVFVSLMMVLIL